MIVRIRRLAIEKHVGKHVERYVKKAMTSADFERLREIPSVDEVVAALGDVEAPRALVLSETRRVIAAMRARLLQGADADAGKTADLVRESIAHLARPSLKHVINATGVILHTNL